MLDTLPWLAGFALVPEGAGFRPVGGMAAVSDLLARAQYEAEHLYHRWSHVSLARLEADGELEVTMTDGSVAVFTTKQDYFRQLAKLDDIIGKLAAMPGAEGRAARIDLSLGREVPVMLRPFFAQGAAPRPALPPGFNVFPASSSPHHREL
jgi:cell division protein FtsQ